LEEEITMTNQTTNDGAIDFGASFAASLAAAVTTATGSAWPLEALRTPDPTSNAGTPIHFRLTAEGGLSGECFIEFYEPQVSELVAKLLKETIVELSDDNLEVLSKVIATAANSLAASLAEKFGTLRFKVDRAAGLAFGGMYVVPLAASSNAENVQVLLYFPGQLLECLSAGTEEARSATEAAISPNNLKLVMDVELNVSLRFGQRQMALREVLELGSGSVIELDRMVDDPVELYLDGKLIARGEAVVVDGNYGLRVTEIPQPMSSHLLN
jgi:flagellar motor switch protein FliN/FliY